jgi:hypothetical protein
MTAEITAELVRDLARDPHPDRADRPVRLYWLHSDFPWELG